MFLPPNKHSSTTIACSATSKRFGHASHVPSLSRPPVRPSFGTHLAGTWQIASIGLADGDILLLGRDVGQLFVRMDLPADSYRGVQWDDLPPGCPPELIVKVLEANPAMLREV